MKWLQRKNEPVFLKPMGNSNAKKKIESLKKLKSQLNTKGQIMLERDIQALEYGIVGEKNIEFELRNSHMPMYVLHDVYFEHDGLSAQIDYLVFTKKICFILECKNLYGDIQINRDGEFIRSMEYNGRKNKEGIYSPITQNQRHLELVKRLIIDSKKNVLTRIAASSFLDNFYQSVVVLSNPKTVLDTRYAKKDVKEKVIRADQLIEYIKHANNTSKELPLSNKEMKVQAESFLKLHQEMERDYTKKYEPYKVSNNQTEVHKDPRSINLLENQDALENSELFEALRAFRLKESRREGIKPYYIYTNREIKSLIHSMPKSIEELRAVNGFGKVKTEKYGEEIIKIIHTYQ